MDRIHIYKRGHPHRPTLVLLHGTGGTEHDLIDMAAYIDETANILSLRGQVSEHGMLRHFARISHGVFDQVDLERRTTELKAFLDWASTYYGIDRDSFIALGYSNGANLAASYAFKYPHDLKGSILLHPMSAGQIDEAINLGNVPIFIGAGDNDEICPPKYTMALYELMKHHNGNLTLSWHSGGHRITKNELDAVKKWYMEYFKS